jgi:hypothetical protein
MKLGELVEEQYTMVGEGDLVGTRHGATVDETGI